MSIKSEALELALAERYDSAPKALRTRRDPSVVVFQEFDCHDCGQRHPWELCPMCGSDVFPTLALMGTATAVVCERFCGWAELRTRSCVMCQDPVDVGRAYCRECELRLLAELAWRGSTVAEA